MRTRFGTAGRNTPIWLPRDLRDWVEPDVPVHFALRLFEALPAHAFHVNHWGTSSKQYLPCVMRGLLIYGYSKTILSSRCIGQATYEDISVRCLIGDTHPAHASIAAFRSNHGEAISRCFVEALLHAKKTALWHRVILGEWDSFYSSIAFSA